MITEKTKLRKMLLQQRNQISQQDFAEQNMKILGYLKDYLRRSTPERVLSFYPHGAEPDLRSLFNLDGYFFALPRVLAPGSMEFAHMDENTPIVRGAYGIYEPDLCSPAIEVLDEMVALVPCIGMDSNGYRIGYGGGYYDRFLAKYDITAIGILFSDFLLSYPFAHEKHDRKLAGYCTDQGLVLL